MASEVHAEAFNSPSVNLIWSSPKPGRLVHGDLFTATRGFPLGFFYCLMLFTG